MEMSIKTVKTLNLALTIEERMALKKADEILLKIQKFLEVDEGYIMALETGEVIDYDDLARARGVMGGIADYSAWIFEEFE